MMSASPSNPFVLPGFGQSGDAATNPLFASLEMMRQAFAGLGGPAGMSGGLGLSPPMNPEELERKIAELKSVENWLKLNLSMLSSTIQGMEVQLATIATLKSFMAAGSAGGANSQVSGAQAAPPSWFSGWPTAAAQPQSNPQPYTRAEVKPQAEPEPQSQAQRQEPAQAAKDADAADRDARATGAAQTTQGDAAAASVAPAAQAWWDMLQQQFGQVAAATAASMAGKPTQAAGQAAAKPARTPKKTTAPNTRQAAANALNKTKTKARPQTTKKAATKPTAE
jgi:hypothetical protein